MYFVVRLHLSSYVLGSAWGSIAVLTTFTGLSISSLSFSPLSICERSWPYPSLFSDTAAAEQLAYKLDPKLAKDCIKLIIQLIQRVLEIDENSKDGTWMIQRVLDAARNKFMPTKSSPSFPEERLARSAHTIRQLVQDALLRFLEQQLHPSRTKPGLEGFLKRELERKQEIFRKDTLARARVAVFPCAGFDSGDRLGVRVCRCQRQGQASDGETQ